MLLDLFLVCFSLIFLFVPCGVLRWLHVSFLLHVKYTISYRTFQGFSGRQAACLRQLSFLFCYLASKQTDKQTEPKTVPCRLSLGRGNKLLDWIIVQMSVNGLDKAGSTPLHWASHGGHNECVSRLLSVANCEINVQVGNSMQCWCGYSWFFYFIATQRVVLIGPLAFQCRGSICS